MDGDSPALAKEQRCSQGQKIFSAHLPLGLGFSGVLGSEMIPSPSPMILPGEKIGFENIMLKCVSLLRATDLMASLRFKYTNIMDLKTRL